jgi:dihydropteroate synthase
MVRIYTKEMLKCPAEENANSERLQPISERKNLEKIGIKTNRPASLPLPGGALLDFSRPLVMSIINCTPDSFYPVSRCVDPEEAAEKALRAQEDGADIVDFGAESTRPGADYLSPEEEIGRLIPALRAFRRKSALPVSVDTRGAAAARKALDEGADIVNDISALADPAMAGLCAERKAAVVLMHMRGSPKTMQERLSPYGDIMGEIGGFLEGALQKALGAGIEKERIILDPGIGFGKSTKDNLLILNRLAEISRGDYPVLVGLSRKNFIGELTGRDVSGRLAGTLGAEAAALYGGADILRVHDTAETADFVRIWHGVVSAYR